MSREPRDITVDVPSPRTERDQLVRLRHGIIST